MEEADEILQGEITGLEDGAAPVAVHTPPQVVKAVKKNDWALRSVLKVFVVKVDPNYAQPWQKCPQRSSSGSAFVLDIAARQIITNAHVVANATTVYVRRPGNPKKWRALVTCLGKPCDLALLTVEEAGFWEDLKPLNFMDEVPELQSPVAVAGYPVGGDSLSITKGIVSRITMVRYSQGGRLLGIQIDAAINPGNSGGPAFCDMRGGSVAGVAFSKNSSSSTDNIGYIIPWAVVRHFLDEYKTQGSFRGLVSPGFYTQPMENPAQQHYLQLPEGAAGGAAVVKLEPISAASGVLQLQDVLLQVEGAAIAADESVSFRDDERLDYWHLISKKHVGEALRLQVLREGKVLDVSYPLSRQSPLVGILHEVDCAPSYLIVGGLVFCPLSLPCLEAVFGSRKWRTLSPISVLAACAAQRTHLSQQVVILVQVLSHEINHGYKHSVVPLETFNSTQVHNLAHLAALVDTATGREEEWYLNFGLEGGRFVTLQRDQVAAAQPGILAVNGIPADRSADLMGPAAAAAAAEAAEYVAQQAAAEAAAAARVAAAGPVVATPGPGVEGGAVGGDAHGSNSSSC